MMENKYQDKGIRKVMQETQKFHLPSNFTYRTMREVEKMVCLREERQERNLLVAAVLVTLSLFVGVVGLINVYWGDVWKGMSQRVNQVEIPLGSLPSEWLILFVLIVVLILFDYGMRKIYFNHHRSE